MTFTVIDTKTGRYPDVEKIALTEEWAKGLIYCDIDCFSIDEDGNLLLTDDCGNSAYCPSDRFKIVWEQDLVEVVRCFVCEKSYRSNGRLMCGINSVVINGTRMGGHGVSDKHFCSYGIRRTDDRFLSHVQNSCNVADLGSWKEENDNG